MPTAHPDSLFEHLRGYLAERCPGAVAAGFHFIASGYECEVYGFTLSLPGQPTRDLVLRLYPGQGAEQKLAREAGGLELLHQAGYPVPAPFLSEPDPAALGHPFAMVEKLSGQALWPVLAGAAPDRAAALLDLFGGLLAHLHRLDWRPFTPQAARYADHPTALLDETLADARLLYTRFGVDGFQAVVDWLERRAPDIRVRPAVVHLDFHANNVFLCPGDRLSVIDWTQITVADYRADLCWTLLVMGDLGQAEWGERILRAYRRQAAYPVEQLDYFQVISDTKLLASTVISLRADPRELGLRAETAQSIQRQAPIFKKLYARVRAITGLRVPEIEAALGS